MKMLTKVNSLPILIIVLISLTFLTCKKEKIEDSNPTEEEPTKPKIEGNWELYDLTSGWGNEVANFELLVIDTELNFGLQKNNTLLVRGKIVELENFSPSDNYFVKFEVEEIFDPIDIPLTLYPQIQVLLQSDSLHLMATADDAANHHLKKVD